jgi:hypothetical protein
VLWLADGLDDNGTGGGFPDGRGGDLSDTGTEGTGRATGVTLGMVVGGRRLAAGGGIIATGSDTL